MNLTSPKPKRTLHREPFEILSAGSANEALQILAREPIDLVISDEMMPGMSGSEFLAEVYRNYPETIKILLTGHANLNVAVRAINEGHIYRFLMKPCNEQEIRITIRQAIQQKELTEKSRTVFKKGQTAKFDLAENGKGISWDCQGRERFPRGHYC